MKTLLIEIYLNNTIEKSDLEFRQIIVGTIEGRGLGEVVEETSAADMLEIVHMLRKNQMVRPGVTMFKSFCKLAG